MDLDLLLSDEDLELVVHNVANSEDGLKLLGHLLSSSGVFTAGLDFDSHIRNDYNKGRSDFGIEIRDLLLQYAFDYYVELLKKGVKQDV